MAAHFDRFSRTKEQLSHMAEAFVLVATLDSAIARSFYMDPELCLVTDLDVPRLVWSYNLVETT
jgi:hypothetical protein